ncbi:MAG: amidohydrolase family protein [Acidobacteriia bacterium]|nr:amidohydrolase family protein [Terriglobia bacterium]
MRIDSHHSFSERYPLVHLETILKRNRFDGSVLVLVTRASLPVLSVPDFVRGIVVPSDLRDPQLPHLLDAYQRHPDFRAVCHRFDGDIPDGLAELERRGIPLDALGGLPLIPRIVDRFPSLRIVIDHLGYGGADTLVRASAPDALPADGCDQWARDIAEAAESPQVFCKLSGVTRLGPSARPCVQHALRVFGPRRLMFGSDWPADLPEHSWKASLAAFTQALGAQPIEVREELLGGTAERFYAL